jgi:hypothetical protein
MQGRHPDHDDPLQKSLEDQNLKNHLIPKAPNNQRALPHDRSQISRGARGDTSHPEKIGLCHISSPPPLYPVTSHPQHHPTGLYLLQLIPGRDRAHVPLRLSELKKKIS